MNLNSDHITDTTFITLLFMIIYTPTLNSIKTLPQILSFFPSYVIQVKGEIWTELLYHNILRKTLRLTSEQLARNNDSHVRYITVSSIMTAKVASLIAISIVSLILTSYDWLRKLCVSRNRCCFLRDEGVVCVCVLCIRYAHAHYLYTDTH